MLNGLYDLLSKIGFADPLHPPITHMPIGLATGAFVFVLIAVIFRKKQMEITVRHVSILAFIFAFPTILLGVFDWMHYYHAVLFTPIVIKMTLAAILLIELAIGIILGNEIKMRSFVMTLLASVGFVAVIGLGWFGAAIVYGRGIDMSQVGPSPAETPAVSVSPSAEPPAKPSSSPAKASVAGESLFTLYCSSCHASGGNIIRTDLPLKTSDRLDSRDEFIAFIRNPTLPNGQPGAMPRFPTQTLPDKAAVDLYQYLSYMAAHDWK